MLVLTRAIGDTIRIGDDVTVQIVDVKGTQVRVGITAPEEIPVHRGELYERIQKQESPSPRR